MTDELCTQVAEQLDELLEEPVAPAAAELRRHVDGCAACRQLLAEATVLGQAARALPREIAPERDLWPGIAAGIERSVVVRERFGAPAWRRWRALAVAATAVVALLVAYQLGRRAAPPRGASPTVAARSDTAGGGLPDAVAQAGYRAARDELMAALAERRDALSPQTLAVVDHNLAVIEGSIENIRTALAADPDNPGLARRLGFVYRQELDLLRRAVTIPTDDELARPARS